MENNIIVYLDSIQRTIVATLVEETIDSVKVVKPAILNVSPTQDKKLQVQLYPLMFREFLKNRDNLPVWSYPRSAITLAQNIELEANLVAQYVEMFKKSDIPAPTIKLFDAKAPDTK